MVLAIWKRVLRRWGEPRLEIRRDLASKEPDWKGGAFMSAKATRAPLWVKRRTSPISAMRCGPVTSPAPYISMITLNSGNREVKRSNPAGCVT